MDWTMIASKAYDAESTALWLPRLMAEGAPVAVAQNGVEHRERFGPWVPQERLVPLVVQISVDRQADDVIWQRGPARLTVEEGRLGWPREFHGRASDQQWIEDHVLAAALQAIFADCLLDGLKMMRSGQVDLGEIVRPACDCDAAAIAFFNDNGQLEFWSGQFTKPPVSDTDEEERLERIMRPALQPLEA